MFAPSRFAYSTIRNYICSQIAFEKEKVEKYNEKYDKKEQFITAAELDYIDDTKEIIETYKKILVLLTNNKEKLTARGR